MLGIRMGFLVDAAILWFLVVFIGQDHDTSFFTLAWKLLLASFVLSMITLVILLVLGPSLPNWMVTTLGWSIMLGGMGYWIQRNFVPEIKKVLLIMLLFFGGSILFRYGSKFFMEWYHQSSVG